MNRLLALAVALLTAACAAPALRTYPLDTAAPVATPPLPPNPVVIEIARITVPDALDTADIARRRGPLLDASTTGRLTSRLSLAATDLITARLAASRPDALVTDHPAGGGGPIARLLITIASLDLTDTGTAQLTADWLLIPSDPATPVGRGRLTLDVQGPVATDADVVALEARLLTQLAGAIDISGLR
jgi:uncharacterized lipoprotein YmbA